MEEEAREDQGNGRKTLAREGSAMLWKTMRTKKTPNGLTLNLPSNQGASSVAHLLMKQS